MKNANEKEIPANWQTKQINTEKWVKMALCRRNKNSVSS